MNTFQRVILKQGAQTYDVSRQMNDFLAANVTFSITAATDFLFIGSMFPFNHKYFDVFTPSTDACVLSMSMWDGKQFIPMVDVYDGTSLSGVTMAKDGLVMFTPDRQFSWVRELDSFDVQGLEDTVIYKMHWLRISFSQNAEFTLRFIGQKFSEDSDLFAHYPDLNNTSLMAQWDGGKINWNDQHFIASEVIISDMIRRGIIWTEDQVLKPEILKQASIHKVAEIIFSAFGEGYLDDKLRARKAFDEAMNKRVFVVDQDLNGRLSVLENVNGVNYLKR